MAARLREYQERRFGGKSTGSNTFTTTGVRNGTRTVTRIEEHVSQRLLPVGARETTLNRSISSIETPIDEEDNTGYKNTKSRTEGHRLNAIDRTGGAKTTQELLVNRGQDNVVGKEHRESHSGADSDKRWQGSRTYSASYGGGSETIHGETKNFDTGNLDRDLEEWLRARRNKTAGHGVTVEERRVYTSSGQTGGGNAEEERRRWSTRTESASSKGSEGWSSNTGGTRKTEDGERRHWATRTETGSAGRDASSERTDHDRRWSTGGVRTDQRQYGVRTTTPTRNYLDYYTTEAPTTPRRSHYDWYGRNDTGGSSRTQSKFNRTSTEIYVQQGSGGTKYNSSVSRFYNESGWGGSGWDKDRRRQEERKDSRTTVKETESAGTGGGMLKKKTFERPK